MVMPVARWLLGSYVLQLELHFMGDSQLRIVALCLLGKLDDCHDVLQCGSPTCAPYMPNYGPLHLCTSLSVCTLIYCETCHS